MPVYSVEGTSSYAHLVQGLQQPPTGKGSGVPLGWNEVVSQEAGVWPEWGLWTQGPPPPPG